MDSDAVPDAFKRRFGVGILLVGSLSYSGLFIWELVTPTELLVRELLNAFSLLFSLGLLAGSLLLWRRGTGGDQVLRVASWALGATVPLLVVGFLGLGWQLALDAEIERGELVVWYLGVVGTFGGLLIGLYDVERRRSTQQLRALVDAAPTAIVAVDTEGRVVEYNDSAEEMFGWTAAEATGSIPPFVDEDSREEYFENVRSVLQGNELRGQHAVRRRKDGSLVDVELWTSRIREADGDVVGIMTVVIDVTREKRRDQAMSVLRRILRHNLRNDGDVILGHSNRIRDAVDRLSDPTRVHGEIEHSAAEINGAARDLIRLGEKARRMEQVLEQHDREPVSVDACGLLEDLTEEFAERHPRAEIRLSCPEPTTLEVSCQIGMAFEELLENAVEHADCDDPVVEVDVERSGEWVTVEVADDGPGVPEVEARALQESEESALVHTSGLGLWLVNWLVTGQGGTLSIRENDMGGCTAVLQFPSTPTEPDDRSRRERVPEPRREA